MSGVSGVHACTSYRRRISGDMIIGLSAKSTHAPQSSLGIEGFGVLGFYSRVQGLGFGVYRV